MDCNLYSFIITKIFTTSKWLFGNNIAETILLNESARLWFYVMQLCSYTVESTYNELLMDWIFGSLYSGFYYIQYIGYVSIKERDRNRIYSIQWFFIIRICYSEVWQHYKNTWHVFFEVHKKKEKLLFSFIFN